MALLSPPCVRETGPRPSRQRNASLPSGILVALWLSVNGLSGKTDTVSQPGRVVWLRVTYKF